LEGSLANRSTNEDDLGDQPGSFKDVLRLAIPWQCSSEDTLQTSFGGVVEGFVDEMLADSDRARRRIHEQHLDDEIAVSLAPQDSPDDAVVVNCEPPLDGTPSEIIEAL